MARVGCTAKIVKVIRRYDDGRMDILTVGMRRFRIARLLTDEAYLQAQVSFFGDDAAGSGGKLVQRCMALYREIYETTPGNLPKADLEGSSATVASFYFAYFSDLSLVRKQQFLELTDPNVRLRELRKAFERRLREHKQSGRRARLVEGQRPHPSAMTCAAAAAVALRAAVRGGLRCARGGGTCWKRWWPSCAATRRS